MPARPPARRNPGPDAGQGVVEVRLIAPAPVLTAALAALAQVNGWQLNDRRPARGGGERAYGTLIVTVPQEPT